MGLLAVFFFFFCSKASLTAKRCFKAPLVVRCIRICVIVARLLLARMGIRCSFLGIRCSLVGISWCRMGWIPVPRSAFRGRGLTGAFRGRGLTGSCGLFFSTPTKDLILGVIFLWVVRNEYDRTGQDRTGQDRTGQDRTGQDRTGQARPGQDRTGQDRTGQDRTGQNRTGQDRTGQDRTGRTECCKILLVQWPRAIKVVSL